MGQLIYNWRRTTVVKRFSVAARLHTVSNITVGDVGSEHYVQIGGYNKAVSHKSSFEVSRMLRSGYNSVRHLKCDSSTCETSRGVRVWCAQLSTIRTPVLHSNELCENVFLKWTFVHCTRHLDISCSLSVSLEGKSINYRQKKVASKRNKETNWR